MAETEILAMFLSLDFIISLALRTVVSGILLFAISRFVGAKGGLLAAMGVAFLTVIITMFVFEAYVYPLLEYEATDIITAIETNIFGLIISYILPTAVWFFVVMILMRVGPVQAAMIAGAQWLLSLALTHFGILVFLTEFL